jgi:hypothetical protein
MSQRGVAFIANVMNIVISKWSRNDRDCLIYWHSQNSIIPGLHYVSYATPPLIIMMSETRHHNNRCDFGFAL